MKQYKYINIALKLCPAISHVRAELKPAFRRFVVFIFRYSFDAKSWHVVLDYLMALSVARISEY